MSKKCSGCGATLQVEDNKLTGYTKKIENDLCERCFRVLHYHEVQIIDYQTEIKTYLDKMNQTKHFTFYFLDLLNINEESISYFKKIKNRKCLLISKLDIIPKSFYKDNIIKWLRDVYQIQDDILFITAKSNNSIKKLEDILEYYKIRTCYFAGMTNAGKSTFINKWYEYVTNKKGTLSVSEVPNTTLDFVTMKINHYTIIDTPGFHYENIRFLDKNDLEKLDVKTNLKPIIYQMKEKESILIEEMVRFEAKHSVNLTFYLPELFEIKKVYAKNQVLKEMQVKTLEIPEQHDLVLKGYGFIYFKGSCFLGVSTELEFEIRPSFLGGRYHETYNQKSS